MKVAHIMHVPSPLKGNEWFSSSPCSTSTIPVQPMTCIQSIDCQALVIGCGVAGNTTALRLADQGIHVTMLSAANEAHHSATYYAQGGIIYKGKEDSPSLMASDIHRAGAGMCDPIAVEKLSTQGPEWVEKMLLEATNVPFERDQDGELARTLEASHNRARILYKADHTGKVITSSMLEAVEKHPNITLVLNQVAMEVLMDQQGICRGMIALSTIDNTVCIYRSDFTLLATGGVGDLYANTSNPTGACGEGIGLAVRAGVKLKNMQYVQFHPTTLYIPGENRFLLTEALRGEGAILRDAQGRAFAKDYHPDGELSPRDVVARMILSEMAKQQASCMYLDITHMDKTWLQHRFPTIYAYCMTKGIDMSKDLMPVVPAAHYHCGGIEVDLNGQTSIQGLYAAGEVSCTGVHGANRLASTSLLEGLVWGGCAADHFLAHRDQRSMNSCGELIIPASFLVKGRVREATEKELKEIRSTLQQVMWESFGPLRSKAGMKHGLQALAVLDQRVQVMFMECFVTHETASLRNAMKAALEIAIAATTATKSVGTHYVM